MKSLLHRLFVFALQVTITQACIAAQILPVTLSLMQRSEEKEIKATQHDCAQSRDEPSAFSTNGTRTLSLTSERLTTTPPGLPVRSSELMRQRVVFNLNQREKSNTTGCCCSSIFVSRTGPVQQTLP